MEYVLSLGFSSSDNEKLQAWLAPLNLQLKVITGSPLLELRKVSSPHPIFINIRSDADLELLKKLVTDFDTHTYACGLTLDKRKEIFIINQIKELLIFFLPLEEAEIKALVTFLKTKFKDYQINMLLTRGLKRIAVHCEWQTQFINISNISRQITNILDQTGFLTSPSSKPHVNLALEEALTNSIEHGNLELDSSLKPNSLFELDQYELLKQQRLKDEKYSCRKITLNIFIYAHQAEVRITDQGPGFNISSINKLHDNPDKKMRQIMHISGKGLFFIKKAFDVVEYKKQGREIILVKRR